jgi:hypothetical protein
MSKLVALVMTVSTLHLICLFSLFLDGDMSSYYGFGMDPSAAGNWLGIPPPPPPDNLVGPGKWF